MTAPPPASGVAGRRATPAAVTPAAATPAPHILLVVADDHATHSIPAYGGKLMETPQLDRIASEGLRFDACFCTNALCAPSRAAILTGTYSHINGVRTLSTLFDARQPTFVSLLRAAGYQTALVGKWHLGHGGVHDPRGFDYWEILEGQGEYWDPELLGAGGQLSASGQLDADGQLGADGTRRTVAGYTTTVLTDLAIDWIRERDRERPFCLLLHHKAPHRSWDPDTVHSGLFAERDLPEPATLFDDYAGRGTAAREAEMRIGRDLTERDLKAPYPPELDEPERTRWAYQRYMKDYLRCVASIDDNLGRLLDLLDTEGLSRDTVVVYTSDQGFFLGDHSWYDKRFMYEESIRMPLLVRYPRLVPPGTATGGLALNVDFAQTFLDLAGVPAHPRMQGRSLLPLLRGERPADWPTSFYYRYWEHDDSSHRVIAHYGVRTSRHKLVYYYGDGFGLPGTSDRRTPPEWELFDLVQDPAELRSVADDPAYADQRAELAAELARLQSAVGDVPYDQPEP